MTMKNLNEQEQKVLAKANELSQLFKEYGIPCYEFKFYSRKMQSPSAIFTGEKDGFELQIVITDTYVSYFEEDIRSIIKSTTLTFEDILNLTYEFYWPVSSGGKREKDNVAVIKFTTKVLKELKKNYKITAGNEFKYKYAIFDKKLMSIMTYMYDKDTKYRQVIYVLNGVIKRVIKMEKHRGAREIYYTINQAFTPLFNLVYPSDVASMIYKFKKQIHNAKT